MKETDHIPRIKVEPLNRDVKSSRKADSVRDSVPATMRISPEEEDVSESLESGPLTSEYGITGKIGQGGMGIVYLGRDQKLGRYVAIKRLSRTTLAQKSLRERFFREAKAIAALNHPYIVHVYSLGEDEDGPYIVMEYVAGPPERSPGKKPPDPFSLADRVQSDGPLPVKDAVDLILCVANAVEYAHRSGVIHRDLKPSNILLDEKSEPRIVDFGLARRVDPDVSQLTVPGEKMLSLGYGAPEQESDASVTDERADVYGLGALLYFCLTGKNPRYFRETDIPESLKTVLTTALEPDRDKRWPSVVKFTEALLLIKAPTRVETPTVKATWHCKWCNTVNPVAVKYCGECGWDGSELCGECGMETRTGIPFCSACGADAREYETARRRLERMRRHWEAKAYERVADMANQAAQFQPVGPRGWNLLQEIQKLGEEARRALTQAEHLKQAIPDEIAAQNYERAQQHIREYHALTADSSFGAERTKLAELMFSRDMERIQTAIQNGEWDYAERTCRKILDGGRAETPEVQKLAAQIKRHKWILRSQILLLFIFSLFLTYGLSAAPLYRLLEPSSQGVYSRFYAPLLHSKKTSLWGTGLRKYAAAWGTQVMFSDSEGPVVSSTDETIPSESPDSSGILAHQTKFQANMDQIKEEYSSKTLQRAEAYLRDLEGVRAKLQKKGDYEGWFTVSREIQNFEEDRTFSEDLDETAPHELTTLRSRYMEQTQTQTLERHRKIQVSSQSYIQQLTALQKDYTMRGNMDEAAAVHSEIKRIRILPEVVTAERELAAYREEQQAQKKTP